MPFWVLATGEVVVDSEGKPIECVDCPCDVGVCDLLDFSQTTWEITTANIADGSDFFIGCADCDEDLNATFIVSEDATPEVHTCEWDLDPNIEICSAGTGSNGSPLDIIQVVFYIIDNFDTTVDVGVLIEGAGSVAVIEWRKTISKNPLEASDFPISFAAGDVINDSGNCDGTNATATVDFPP
ncbi:MAG: hypothetical protein GTO41_19990 [Burkholderiales bacterium]|nr:hypothetical protein [Burkholderiales bacterium]